MTNSYFIHLTSILEQGMDEREIDSFPNPTGIWPLLSEIGSEDIGEQSIASVSSHVGYDPRWTPASLLGSAIFSGNVLSQESFIDVAGDSSGPFVSNEITLLAWIHPEENMEQSMTLLDFRELPSGSNVVLKLENGQLTMSIPISPTERQLVSSLGNHTH